MNKTLHIALAAAAVVFAMTGCAKVNVPDAPEGQEITINATFAENQTKTTLQDGGTSVYWEAGDEIKLFYDGTGSRFTSQCTNPSKTSKFSGSLSVMFGFGEDSSDSTPIWGLYPYRSDATSDNSSVTTTLPSEQTGKAGSFAKGMNISLAKSYTQSMGFYNVCGGVRFSVTRDDVKDVVFEALNGESIAGKVKLGFEGGVPVVQEIVEGVDSITLTAPAGGVFETGKWYYIIVLPGTLSGGFKMTFNTETKYAVLKSTDSRTIKRGKFGSLADADEDLVYKDKGTPEPGEDIIVFRDNVAKVACVEKFDTNGDGEVSYDEAAAVTSIYGLFADYNTVSSFDELKYFTGITYLSSALRGLKSLKSATVPAQFTALEDYAFNGCTVLDSVTFAGNNVKSIGQYAFGNCNALVEIALPSAVETIGQYAFQYCSALTSIEIPIGVTEVRYGCFQGCTSLKTASIPTGLICVRNYAFDDCHVLESIDLPSGLKTVGEYAFRNCRAFKTMGVPETVISIGSGAFMGCTSLESAVLPSGLGSISSELFSGCFKLYAVTFPTAVTTIGNRAFYSCRMFNPLTKLSKVELPESITSIGTESFQNGVLNVLVYSSSMVSISTNSFSSEARIFVPDAKVETYKIRTNWSKYAENIYALSSYNDSPEVAVAVDLGLSVKWASCNVGAALPEDYGSRYAWGETLGYNDGKTTFDWSTYKWCNGSMNTLTKYNTRSDCGTVDNKTTLEAEDDVAHIKWGDSWRMPTYTEYWELIENCTRKWTTVNGVNGCLVTSNMEGYTDKSIFLPAVGSGGNYWSSLCGDSPYWALSMYFDTFYMGMIVDERCRGLYVRPVYDK